MRKCQEIIKDATMYFLNFSAHSDKQILTHWADTKWPKFYRQHFKLIFLSENCSILIQVWLKFVPQDKINNEPGLVQIMVWRQSGNKPLSEPMMAYFVDMLLGLDELYITLYEFVCKISNTRHTKSPKSTGSRLGVRLSFRNILKPSIEWRMKM